MNGKINKNFTIFGATGDLSYRKLFPALYNMYLKGTLNENDRIIAIGRRDYSDDDYKNSVREKLIEYKHSGFTEDKFLAFANLVCYYKMDFNNLSDYEGLSKFFCLDEIKESIFYLAVAPKFFPKISDGINSLRCRGNSKVIVEKPFGDTIEQAKKLSEYLEENFGAENIYRIDHYLGKEMVQNLLTIRTANTVFKNCWNKESISHVEIVAKEKIGIETRGDYYDATGALKDMVQNHLFQILSLIAMEEPVLDSDIKQNQLNVVKALRSVKKEEIEKSLLLGSYKGYTNEKGVDENSHTETFAICKLYIDNARWEGVPFYIMTGKCLDDREMEVVITFKENDKSAVRNKLRFKIQPEEGVTLSFNIKNPGENNDIVSAEMDFCQSCVTAYRINTPEAYERLLSAVVKSDSRWFSDWEQIHHSWIYIEELKAAYSGMNIPLFSYDVGAKISPYLIDEK